MVTDRRAARHERTKAEILGVAWELSDEHGLAGWSLRDVAEAVGMRAPSLYSYFDSKNALYDAMFADGYRQLLTTLPVPNTRRDPERLLRSGIRAYVDYCVARPSLYQLLFLRTLPGFEPGPESYAAAVELLDRMRAALDRVGVTGDRALDLWTAVISGLIAQQTSNEPGGRRWRRLVDDAVTLLLTRADQEHAI
jgi:AcrR family transcriptional regulator